jgi:hypothetical protein
MKKLTIIALLLGLYLVGVIYQIVLPDRVTRAPAQATEQAAPVIKPAPAKPEPSLAAIKPTPPKPEPSLSVMQPELASAPGPVSPAHPESASPARADSPPPGKMAAFEEGDRKPYPQSEPGVRAPAGPGTQFRDPGENGGERAASRQAMNGLHAGSIEAQIETYISEVHFKDGSKFLDLVDYFDRGIVPREVAERDAERYVRRWPHRAFELTPGSLRVRQERGRYIASFLYSYEVSRGRRTRTGTGASTLELVMMDGEFYVARIKESVHRDPD